MRLAIQSIQTSRYSVRCGCNLLLADIEEVERIEQRNEKMTALIVDASERFDGLIHRINTIKNIAEERPSLPVDGHTSQRTPENPALIKAVDEECECGGLPVGDPNACAACRVWHRYQALTTTT